MQIPSGDEKLYLRLQILPINISSRTVRAHELMHAKEDQNCD